MFVYHMVRDTESSRRTDGQAGDRDGLSRRGVLVGAAVGFTTGGAFGVGPGAASDVDEAVAAAGEYDTRGSVTRALATGTRELRETLVDEGYLDTADAAVLVEPDLLSVPEYLDADEGMLAVGTVHHGDPTAKLEVKRQLPDHELTVVLYPETGETFAAVETADGTREVVGSAGSDGASTQGHSTCPCAGPGRNCDYYYDSGGQRWCVSVWVYDCECGTQCHSADHSCDSCSDIC